MHALIRKLAASCAALAAAAVSAVAAAQQPVNLTIASFSQGSGWYVYAVNLAELLRQAFPPGSKIDSPPIAGSVGNIRLVSEGKADMGFGMALVDRWAETGTVAFDKPLPNLRALVGGWDQYYLVPVAAGKDVGPGMDKFLTKDRPKTRVATLPRGGVGPVGAAQLLGIMNAGEEELKKRGGNNEYVSFAAVKGLFTGRNVDLFIHVLNPGHPTVTEIAQSVPVTFLQPPQSALEAMAQKYGWGIGVMPKGTFPTQDQDIRLPATHTTLFASTRMPDDVAYTVVKTICERTEQLRAAHKGLADFDCAKGAWSKDANGLPLHAGAARYYRERGWLK
jgi:TRAP transporter TAXI family solute receptor